MSGCLQTEDIQDYDSVLEPVQTVKLFGLNSNSALCELNLFVWLRVETRRKTGRLCFFCKTGDDEGRTVTGFQANRIIML